MGRRQKSAYFDEGVCELIDHIQMTTGATFPRVITAFVLESIFGPLRLDDPGERGPSRLRWMAFAVRIEDSSFSVGDIPDELLQSGFDAAKHYYTQFKELAKKNSDDPALKEQVRHWATRSEQYTVALSRWERLVARWSASTKGNATEARLQAIKATLESGGFQDPKTWKTTGIPYQSE
jgi:hypothetical protein